MDTRWDFVKEKAFTFLTDRRLWLAVFAFIFVVRGGAEDLNATETLSDQAVNWVTIILTAVQALAWSVRPPTSREKSDPATILEALIDG